MHIEHYIVYSIYYKTTTSRLVQIALVQVSSLLKLLFLLNLGIKLDNKV